MGLPDISDLLEAEKGLFDSQQKLNAKQQELNAELKSLEAERNRLRERIVNVYKTAQVTSEECDHPVVKYQGMGMTQCRCCDKYIP
ncbi:MAG: hypothetical protein AABW48_00540 [Nanoarchaeota archaeon]